MPNSAQPSPMSKVLELACQIDARETNVRMLETIAGN
jgi:hypothetical protein